MAKMMLGTTKRVVSGPLVGCQHRPSPPITPLGNPMHDDELYYTNQKKGGVPFDTSPPLLIHGI